MTCRKFHGVYIVYIIARGLYTGYNYSHLALLGAGVVCIFDHITCSTFYMWPFLVGIKFPLTVSPSFTGWTKNDCPDESVLKQLGDDMSNLAYEVS